MTSTDAKSRPAILTTSQLNSQAAALSELLETKREAAHKVALAEEGLAEARSQRSEAVVEMNATEEVVHQPRRRHHHEIL